MLTFHYVTKSCSPIGLPTPCISPLSIAWGQYECDAGSQELDAFPHYCSHQNGTPAMSERVTDRGTTDGYQSSSCRGRLRAGVLGKWVRSRPAKRHRHLRLYRSPRDSLGESRCPRQHHCDV